MPNNELLAAKPEPILLARQILEHDSESFHPALLERATSASLGLIPVSRKSSQPNYISDLGLRPSRDPLEFLRLGVENVERLRSGLIAERIEAGSARLLQAWESGRGSESGLAAILDAYVSFAGQWDEARRLVQRIVTGTRRPREYRLALYCAAILGATSSSHASADDSLIDALFRQASALTPTPSDHALVLLRLAAWRTKRKGDPTSARLELLGIRERITDAMRNLEVSPADASTVIASTHNLEALTYVRAGDHRAALDLVVQAQQMESDDRWVTIDADAAYRYRSQVLVNVAQMQWKVGNRADAYAALETNLELTRVVHQSSRSEALSIAAYYSYLGGDHYRAWDQVVQAHSLIAAEGSPTRLLKIRKIAIAVLDALGRAENAERILALATADPVGLEADLA